MEKAFLLGETGKYTMGNFRMVKSKDLEFGKESSTTHISGNGPTIKLRDMGFISGKMAIDTRESGLTL